MIPIAGMSKAALVGAGIAMGILGILVLGVWGISKFDKTDLLYGVTAVLILAMVLLVVSLIVKEILIPIGPDWDNALIGAAISMGILGLLGLGVWGLSKFSKKDLLYGAGAVALLAAALLLISVAVNLMIPIGK